MFRIKNYFRERRERKLRERLVLKLAHTEDYIENYYRFILTGHY
jgi:hypothetical protein